MSEEIGVDRRVIRTKVAIRQALVHLIEEKGFDAISVKDITKRADINRGTFYLHYRDKFDLLEQLQADIIHDFEEIILHTSSLGAADFKVADRPLPVVVSMFEYLKDNASLMHAILGLKGDIAFQDLLKKSIERNLKAGFLINIKPENFLVPSDYLLSYVLSAHFGVIQAWLQKGCIETPQDMALYLSRLSISGPVSAIRVSSKV